MGGTQVSGEFTFLEVIIFIGTLGKILNKEFIDILIILPKIRVPRGQVTLWAVRLLQFPREDFLASGYFVL